MTREQEAHDAWRKHESAASIWRELADRYMFEGRSKDAATFRALARWMRAYAEADAFFEKEFHELGV